jgi:transposase InsO family protein
MRARRPGLTAEERARLTRLERENAEVHPGERDPPEGVGGFRPRGARPPRAVMVAFIDAHRGVYGVEPICAVLPMAPSVYYAHKAWAHTLAGGGGRTERSTGCARSGSSFSAATAATRPWDLVTRQFTATRPNRLWVADPTSVAPWRGFVYVAFVIDGFSRRIVGWVAYHDRPAAPAALVVLTSRAP